MVCSVGPMRHNIYLPDDLSAALAVEKDRINLSGIAQEAVRKELAMLAAQEDRKYERHEIWVEGGDRKVAIQAEHLASDQRVGVDVYLTEKGNLFVAEEPERYGVYDDFDALVAEGALSTFLLNLVAQKLGLEYIEELDV